MTSGYATPPEVVEQIKALAAQGLGLSAIARQLDRPKSTVHRVMTRTGAAKPRPKRVHDREHHAETAKATRRARLQTPELF